ncbi:MAG: SRPBCC domain-containing protein [Candidatus Zixiibacteriota bacterium]|nr:MAG: SRPBCC domain-containing protein [candidate division Zixibacteria bacterium]
MPDIKHLLTIEAPASKVYKAITDEKGLAGWWTEETKAEPTVGSIAEFRFGERYLNRMRITDLVPHKKVTWECIEGDKEWIGTRFVFDLEEREGKTVTRFAHADWRADTDLYALCNYHWGRYMVSLKNYCETGKGAPYQEP